MKKINILLLFLLCSCVVDTIPKSWDWGARPRPITGTRGFPEANTEYGIGFKDGCVAGFDAVSRGILSDLKTSYNYNRVKKDASYEAGWTDGLEQCTYIMDWDVI